MILLPTHFNLSCHYLQHLNHLITSLAVHFLLFAITSQIKISSIHLNLSHFLILPSPLLFAYLFCPLAHYYHPNHFFIPRLLTSFPHLFFLLFFLIFTPSHCLLTIKSLLIALLFIHRLPIHHPPSLYHFSYLVLALNFRLIPSFHQLIFLILPFSHRLLLTTILNTCRLQNLLPFQCHFLIFYSHLHLCSALLLCVLEFAPQIQLNRQHFMLPHGLLLLQSPRLLQLLMSHFARLTTGSILRKDHFFKDWEQLKQRYNQFS